MTASAWQNSQTEHMTIEWNVGDRGRVGDAEFEVTDTSPRTNYVHVQWEPDRKTDNNIRCDILAAMGAVRLPPAVPPTTGTPQSVRDNPPPLGEYVLVWRGTIWASCWSDNTIDCEWWMPQPAPPDAPRQPAPPRGLAS